MLCLLGSRNPIDRIWKCSVDVATYSEQQTRKMLKWFKIHAFGYLHFNFYYSIYLINYLIKLGSTLSKMFVWMKQTFVSPHIKEKICFSLYSYIPIKMYLQEKEFFIPENFFIGSIELFKSLCFITFLILHSFGKIIYPICINVMKIPSCYMYIKVFSRKYNNCYRIC